MPHFTATVKDDGTLDLPLEVLGRLRPGQIVGINLPDIDPLDPEASGVKARSVAGLPQDHFYFTATDEEFESALAEIAASCAELPYLPDDAYDRENIYEDRL